MYNSQIKLLMGKFDPMKPLCWQTDVVKFQTQSFFNLHDKNDCDFN